MTDALSDGQTAALEYVRTYAPPDRFTAGVSASSIARHLGYHPVRGTRAAGAILRSLAGRGLVHREWSNVFRHYRWYATTIEVPDGAPAVDLR